jgi:hypothetical protein
MQSASSDGSGSDQGDDLPACDAVQLPEPTTTAGKKSIWAKAKATLADVSTQASSTSGTLASKAAAIGAAGAAKTAVVSKQTVAAAGGLTRGAVETSIQAYAGSKLESAVNYLDGELDQRGAKKAIKDTTGAVVGKLDQVTGKRLIELLEAKLKVQDTYNDILATRLAEAFERITSLEVRVSELQNGPGAPYEH